MTVLLKAQSANPNLCFGLRILMEVKHAGIQIRRNDNTSLVEFAFGTIYCFVLLRRTVI